MDLFGPFRISTRFENAREVIHPFLGCVCLSAGSLVDVVVDGTDSAVGEGASVVFGAEAAHKFPSDENEKSCVVEHVQNVLKSLLMESHELSVVVDLDDGAFLTIKMKRFQRMFEILCHRVDVSREMSRIDLWDVRIHCCHLLFERSDPSFDVSDLSTCERADVDFEEDDVVKVSEFVDDEFQFEWRLLILSWSGCSFGLVEDAVIIMNFTVEGILIIVGLIKKGCCIIVVVVVFVVVGLVGFGRCRCLLLLLLLLDVLNDAVDASILFLFHVLHC